ncbi:HAD family phosphatase [Deinococcus rubellus]|uniref:HAD-IA family hydrolase n=1 Tax=Deinococcus rubellus TaxID=1889240 RepID=A0ABY5YE11_9DEIO|nr:HAD-IA family hydrolase [Deinococcus rubellus]UWX63058.1 HAD-IA family hydrolase [Deinococcus rubellus]
MIRAVLFDRDDTLSVMDAAKYPQAAAWAQQQFGVDAGMVLRVMHQHWQRAFGEWWDLRTLDDERAFWTKYSRGLAADLSLSDGQGEAFLAKFPYQVFMKAAPQARAVLEALRERGLKIGVLSNTLPNIWPTLDAIGLADLVDVALSSCALGVHKPALEVFRLAASELGVACGEVLFLDDKPENVVAAREVGMRAELVDLSGEVAGALVGLWEVVGLLDG